DPAAGSSSCRYWLQTRMLSISLRALRSLASAHVSNSEAGRSVYEAKLGVPVTLIRNGIDTSKFQPYHGARDFLAKVTGIPSTSKFIGIVANCSVYKDYPTFIRAAKAVAEQYADTHFIAIGENRNSLGAKMLDLVNRSGLSQ